MGNRDEFLKLADDIRTIKGPDDFDMCPLVTIRQRTWTGGMKHKGTFIDSDLVLAQKYPVRHVKSREIAGSGGVYQLGDIRVAYITPKTNDGTVGYSEAELNPRPTDRGVEVYYIITGHELGGEYSFVDCNFEERRQSYHLILRRRLSTP